MTTNNTTLIISLINETTMKLSQYFDSVDAENKDVFYCITNTISAVYSQEDKKDSLAEALEALQQGKGSNIIFHKLTYRIFNNPAYIGGWIKHLKFPKNLKGGLDPIEEKLFAISQLKYLCGGAVSAMAWERSRDDFNSFS